MVKIGDVDDPVIEPQVWLEIEQHNHSRSKLLAGVEQNESHHSQSHVRREDVPGFFIPEERAPRGEVAVS